MRHLISIKGVSTYHILSNLIKFMGVTNPAFNAAVKYYSQFHGTITSLFTLCRTVPQKYIIYQKTLNRRSLVIIGQLSLS